jgi:hypothetical protein
MTVEPIREASTADKLFKSEPSFELEYCPKYATKITNIVKYCVECRFNLQQIRTLPQSIVVLNESPLGLSIIAILPGTVARAVIVLI